MWNTFKYSALSLIREKSIVIWALLFPLILASLFSMMFSEIDSASSFSVISTGVVEDEKYKDAEAFKAMVDQLAEEGADQTINAHFVATAEEAQALLSDGTITGYYAVDDEGDPELFVASTNDLAMTGAIDETILKTILDNYVRKYRTVETMVEENPLVLTDKSTLESIYNTTDYTEEISIFANTASGSVRYFYALLGFASIMAANVGLIAITRTQGNLSAIGARRMVGALSRTKTLASTLLAAWLVAFVCLTVAFLFIRFMLGIDFGGRDIECIFGILIASLMSTALGAMVGSIPKLGEGAKSGILTGLSCTLAFFAGLYGTASQRFADDLSKSAPLLQTLNPAKQVGDLFYNLYFYHTIDQFFVTVGILLSMAVLLLVIAGIFMRRQRYASI